jgi:hypothetical protein
MAALQTAEPETEVTGGKQARVREKPAYKAISAHHEYILAHSWNRMHVVNEAEVQEICGVHNETGKKYT